MMFLLGSKVLKTPLEIAEKHVLDLISLFSLHFYSLYF